MRVKRIEHLTLTVADVKAAQRFYHEVFDMPTLAETDNEITLRCGHHELTLANASQKELAAKNPTIGAADLQLIVGDNMEDVLNHLKSYFVDIVAGPLKKKGLEGDILSVYIKDDDGNLIEVSTYSNR